MGLLGIYLVAILGGAVGLARWAPSVWSFGRGTQQQRVVFGLCTGVVALLGVVWCYLTMSGIRLSDEYLRVVWQLMKGGIGGIPLLIGCIMVFKQRGGIVVIHAGIALMMFGEL